jgi:hypothetical protein
MKITCIFFHNQTTLFSLFDKYVSASCMYLPSPNHCSNCLRLAQNSFLKFKHGWRAQTKSITRVKLMPIPIKPSQNHQRKNYYASPASLKESSPHSSSLKACELNLEQAPWANLRQNSLSNKSLIKSCLFQKIEWFLKPYFINFRPTFFPLFQYWYLLSLCWTW